MAERVLVGVVVGAQGLKGALRVKSFTADPLDIASYGPVEDEAGARRFRLKVTGEAKGTVIASVEGVKDRNAAEALKGTRFYVPRAALPASEDEDEFYHADLIGLPVELADGAALGKVRAVWDFGAGDVLEIARPDGEVMMLPFTKAAVPVVDVKGGRLIATPPEEVEARPEAEEADGEGGREESGHD